MDRQVAAVAHKIGAGRAGPAGGGGDRPVHARDRRGDPAAGRGRAALHRGPPAGVLRRHLVGARGAGPGRRPGPGRRGRRPGRPLKDLGCTESLDVRRAMAVGELARRQLALDLDTGPGELGGRPHDRPKPTRRAARRGAVPAPAPVRDRGRRQWGAAGWRTPAARSPSSRSGTGAATPTPRCVVKPVIDLADHVHVEAYEVPDRIAEAGRPARRDLRVPLVHPTRPPAPARPAPLRLRPRRPPHQGRGRPAPVSSRRCAGDTTGSRPTAAGPTRSSSPAPTCGRARTATSTSATTRAPSTSAATAAHPPHHRTSSHPAPHPAPGRGHRHARRRRPRGHGPDDLRLR